MALKDNSPTLSYVAWSDLLITYEGTTYKIQNSYTNMKYIYWDITNPYTLQCFNKTQQQAPGMRQVFINDNGMGTQRTHEDIVMTWDGNNNDLIASQIFALHESNKVTGNKFVAIETDIEGVRQSVGETNTELGKVSERVSQIKQQADVINISVSELNKTFTDTQEVLELRENLNKSIITLNSSVGLFKSEFSSYYKNNLIDSQEQVKINTHLDILDNNKLDLLKYIAIVETIIKEEGQTSQVIVLNSAKDQLSNSIDNIRTYTLGAISDGTIVPSEVTFITNLFSKVNIAINELKNVCDDCIFLGAGGKISEELAKISIKSDEIILSVSNAEEAIKSNLGVEKNLLQGNIKDFRLGMEDLNKSIDSLSKDGVVDDTDKTIINNKILEIESEKNDIVNKYNELSTSELISPSNKSELDIEFNKFIEKYNSMVNTIHSVTTDEFFNDYEKMQVENLINETLICLSNLHPVLSQAIDNVQLNTQKKEVLEMKNELNGNIADVENKVVELNTYVNTTFEDNILDETERKDINNNLEDLRAKKIDVDGQYNHLIDNPLLSIDLKNRFKESYDTLINIYNNLVETMEYIINKSELINESDRTRLDKDKNDFNISIANFSKSANEVLENIGANFTESSFNQLSDKLDDLNVQVDNIIEDLRDFTADGVIDNAEKLAIEQNIKVVETEFAKNEVEYNNIYNSTNLNSSQKDALRTSFNAYKSKYQNLINIISNILSMEEFITDENRDLLNTSYSEYNYAIKDYLLVLYNSIDIINIKNITDAKTELNEDITNIGNSLNNLSNTMNGVFKDGLLSDSEKLAIKQNLQIISKEKVDVDEQYLSIYNNVDLIGDAKTNFKLAYDSYCAAYTDVVSVIDGILNKVGLIDSSDKDLLDSKFKNYSNCSGDYSKAVNDAIDNISNTKAARTEEEAKKFTEAQIKIVNDAISLKVSKSEIDETIDSKIDLAKAEIKITTDEITQQVSQKIGKDNVISTINQSAESIKINASKINLSGYVTVTNLKTSGSTTINGGNITTGTIDASLANITNINASNITSGTINASLVKIKGSTTKKIVMGDDNYCVYDGTETDVNRKIFMGFRRHSDTISVPSIILGSNGVNPNVDGAVISGGTYTTYSHYKNNDNPEGINQSYGALAFKYNAASNDICTLNMYQDGNVGLQAGSSVYLRADKATNSTAQLVIQSDSVLSRKPFSCSSTIYSTGNITTAGALNVTGAITGNSTLSVGAITGKSTISASGQISTSSTMYASGSITSNAGIYANTDIKANRVYANQFFVASNSQQIFKHLYTDWIANGCNWDWQGHYLNGAVVGGSIIEMNTVEDDIKSLDLNDLDTIKQIKFREITKYNGDTEECIDISDVTNRDEITSGRSVDLIKLVHLLVKEVQYLKMRMNGE